MKTIQCFTITVLKGEVGETLVEEIDLDAPYLVSGIHFCAAAVTP